MSIERDRQSVERNFQEETAAELTPPLQVPPTNNRQTDETAEESIGERHHGEGGTVIGITGLVLSLISLFTLPFLLALGGIGAGFIASRRGAVSLGKWSIGIGLISMIGAMIFAPFIG